jgi:hypothetical protein
LIRNPGIVFDDVLRGERFIVCRYHRPVATLQPIDGWVTDGAAEHAFDIYGSPLGDPAHEIAKLSEHQRQLILNTLRLNGRFIHDGPGYAEAIDDLVLRGFARRKQGMGHVITGRGMVLKESLQQRAG